MDYETFDTFVTLKNNKRKTNTMTPASTLGDKISLIRKWREYSQEELAHLIGISRSSLVQIEKGNRNVHVHELKSMAHVLRFSIDKFLAEDFDVEKLEIIDDQEKPKQDEVRMSIPSLQVEKMKNVLLYILSKCAGMPNIGETVLNKLLYFADFNYYEIYEEQLTGAKYTKMQYGPVPASLDTIVEKMNKDGLIQRIHTTFYDLPQKRLIPLKEPDLTQLKASETEILDNVIEQFSHWTAKAISDYSHKDLPWIASEMGEEIDYELAFYREAPYSVRTYNEE